MIQSNSGIPLRYGTYLDDLRESKTWSKYQTLITRDKRRESEGRQRARRITLSPKHSRNIEQSNRQEQIESECLTSTQSTESPRTHQPHRNNLRPAAYPKKRCLLRYDGGIHPPLQLPGRSTLLSEAGSKEHTIWWSTRSEKRLSLKSDTFVHVFHDFYITLKKPLSMKIILIK